MGTPAAAPDAWVADTRIEQLTDEVVQHQCFSVRHLAEMEFKVREFLEIYQAQVDLMAKYRQAIVRCLHDHHHLSYVEAGDRLGISGSRAEQIAKGKR